MDREEFLRGLRKHFNKFEHLCGHHVQLDDSECVCTFGERYSVCSKTACPRISERREER